MSDFCNAPSESKRFLHANHHLIKMEDTVEGMLNNAIEIQGQVAAIAELIPEWEIRKDLDPKKLLAEIDNFLTHLRVAMKNNGL